MSEHLDERLTSLVDGQLGHNERDRALAHLARCSRCQAEVAEQRFLKSRLTTLAEPALPVNLTSTLLGLGAREYSAARAAAPPPRPVPRAPRRMPVAASGFVAASSVERQTSHVAGARSRRAAAAGRQQRLAGAESQPLSGGRARPVPAAGSVAAAGPFAGASPRAGRRRPSTVSRGQAGPVGPGPRPASGARSTGGIRMRRTLIGSVAFMLLAVSGSALADGRASSGPSGPPRAPAPNLAAPVPAKAPSTGVSRVSPMIASVSFPRP